MKKVYYLPYPPSVNSYYGTRAHGKRIIKFIKQEGKSYRRRLEDDVVQQNLQTIYDQCHMEIIFYPPDLRKRDNDNILKAFLDALVHCRVINDDSQIDQLVVKRGEKYKGVGMIQLTITDADRLESLPIHLTNPHLDQQLDLG